MTDTALITKYRPSELNEIIGQDAVVNALNGIMKKKTSKSFLFVGPPGTGKTTLARIIATMAGCEPSDLREIDAATFTGIDDMRAVTAGLSYKPLGAGSVKAIIIDECHALSKATWGSLLKILEEPPAWVYWFLCTTETSKVPAAILTRCTRLELKAVPARDIEVHLHEIAALEKLKVSEDIIKVCAAQAGGSPRQALSNLALCSACKSKEEAAELLRSASDIPAAFQLAQLLIKNGPLMEALALVKEMQGTAPEGIRHVVRAYATTCVLGAKNERAAFHALHVLECFSTFFNDYDQLSPVVLAVARALGD